MKAFLLSAGLGTRLKPLTDEIPKCLLTIGGKPLLQIWMELMARHGVSEVLVNTHWHAKKVEGFIKEAEKVRKSEDMTGERWPEAQLFHEAALLGSAGTLLANKEWVSDGKPFLILYGDNLTDVNLGKMLKFHEQHNDPFTLGVFKSERPKECGIAEVDAEGVVTTFIEKPEEPKSDLAAAGVYVADSRIFDFFPENAASKRPLDLGFDVIPNLVGKMKVFVIEEFLMDIGTVGSYEKAQEMYPRIWLA